MIRRAVVDWEGCYTSRNTPWDRGGVSPPLTDWIARGRLPGGRALVPGCGRGHEVVSLAQHGWQVTAVDMAPSALGALREALARRNLSAELVEADLLSWQPAGPFDLIYEQTSLCALAPTDWPAYADRLAEWLVPGGVLAALFMQTGQTGGPPYHCDLTDMRRLFSGARWRWPQAPPERIEHPAGLTEYAVLLRRREQRARAPFIRCVPSASSTRR